MSDEGLSPELLLQAYAAGVFPMAESRNASNIFWVDPRRRGILPLDRFHISRSLARRIRRGGYRISFDTAFERVLQGCAERTETWINDTIYGLCMSLHASGNAHSVEVWEGRALVGGVYGIALGGAFFGESMFSRATDASKVGLVYLVDRLRSAGFALFDTQFITPHLTTLGAIEITRDEYRDRLAEALALTVTFPSSTWAPPAQEVLQRMTQTS